MKELNLGQQAALFGLLSSGECVSHPTELVARHAGELAKGGAAKDWFDLSILQCERAPTGTIRAFGEFTSRLRNGAGEPSGIAGSVSNPTFEYR